MDIQPQQVVTPHGLSLYHFLDLSVRRGGLQRSKTVFFGLEGRLSRRPIIKIGLKEKAMCDPVGRATFPRLSLLFVIGLFHLGVTTSGGRVRGSVAPQAGVARKEQERDNPVNFVAAETVGNHNGSGVRIQKSVVSIIWAKKIRREQMANTGARRNVPCDLQWLILAYYILNSDS